MGRLFLVEEARIILSYQFDVNSCFKLKANICKQHPVKRAATEKEQKHKAAEPLKISSLL